MQKIDRAGFNHDHPPLIPQRVQLFADLIKREAQIEADFLCG
ncbi:Uncharacterised protein [Klebsiella pneumoniae]|nr:Uncharacterised protein [Klebsiella pneumoniae]